MLLKYFNSNRLSVFYIIPLLMTLCWLPSFIIPDGIVSEISSPPGILGRHIIRFNQDFSTLAAITAMIIVIINGFLLIQLNITHLFIPCRTQLPALFYMLICSAFPFLHRFTPALVADSLIILLLFRVFDTYKKDSLSLNFLDAGILISLASFFYPPALFFYPVLLIIMFIIRSYNWREWVFSAIGLLLPYLLLIAIYYLIEAEFAIITEGIRNAFLVEQYVDFGMGSLAFMAYLILLLLVGSFNIIRIMGNIKIQSRKFFLVFFWIFFFAVLIYFAIPSAGFEILYFLSIPVAFLLSLYFTNCRQSWINSTLLFLFFAGIIAVQIFR